MNEAAIGPPGHSVVPDSPDGGKPRGAPELRRGAGALLAPVPTAVRRTAPDRPGPWSTPRPAPPRGRRSSRASGTGRPSSSASRTTGRSRPRRLRRPGGTHRHEPAHEDTLLTEHTDQLGHRRRAGDPAAPQARPCPPGRGRPRPGRWRAMAPPPPAGTPTASSHHRGETGDLVALDGAQKMPRRLPAGVGASAAALSISSVRSSRRGRRSPRQTRPPPAPVRTPWSPRPP